jgi:hypothetical protein
MTPVNSYRRAWQEHYKRNEEGYRQMLGDDPFEGFETSSGPQSRCWCDLIIGLNILYSHSNDIAARQFLERVIVVANRILVEDCLKSVRCIAEFPSNRAELMTSLAFARALLNRGLDQAMLVEAAADFEEWNRRSIEDGDWDVLAESDYLHALRLSLIAGDNNRVKRLSAADIIFEFRADEFHILQLLSIGPQYPLPLKDEALLNRFDVYFDHVRDFLNPPQNVLGCDLTRLELGVIRVKYFGASGGSIDWKEVIEIASQ